MLSVVAGCDGCEPGDFGELFSLLTPSVNTLDFGEVYVGAQPTIDLALRANGNTPANVSAIEVTAPFLLERGTPGSVAVDSDLVVTLAFAPTVPGEVSGELTLTSDASNLPVIRIALRGTGLPALDCDDGNPCTEDLFDPDAGACTTTNLDATSCDDDNACTEDDRCDRGTCVGDAVVCSDTVACTRDVCDPNAGCVFIPDGSLCVDGDPCTLDECAATGCTNPPAPDFTLCGEIDDCVSIELCLAQVCQTFPIPEGAPCNDGDVCTVSDVCELGACVGVSGPSAPGIVENRGVVAIPYFRPLRRGSLFVGSQFDYTLLEVGPFSAGPRAPFLPERPHLEIFDVDGRYAVTTDLDNGEVLLLDLANPTLPTVVDRLPRSTNEFPIVISVASDSFAWCEFGDDVIARASIAAGSFGAVTTSAGCVALQSGRSFFGRDRNLRIENSVLTISDNTGALLEQRAFPDGNYGGQIVGRLLLLTSNPSLEITLIDARAVPVVVTSLPGGVVGLSESEVLLQLVDGSVVLVDADTPNVQTPVSFDPPIGETFSLYFDDEYLLASSNGLVVYRRTDPTTFVGVPVEGSGDAFASVLVEDGLDWIGISSGVTRYPPNPPGSLSGVSRIDVPFVRVLDVAGVRSLFVSGRGEPGGVSIPGVVVTQGQASFSTWRILHEDPDAFLFASGTGCIVLGIEHPFAGTGSSLVVLDACLGQTQNPPVIRVLNTVPVSGGRRADRVIVHQGYASVLYGQGDLSLYRIGNLLDLEEIETLDTGLFAARSGGYDAGVWASVVQEQNATTAELRTFDVSGSAVSPRGAIDIDVVGFESAEVVEFLWPVVFVSTGRSLTLYSVAGDPIVPLVSLPLHGVSSLADAGDALVVAHQAGLATVSPPCPP